MLIGQKHQVQPRDIAEVRDIRADGRDAVRHGKGAVVLRQSRPTMTSPHTHDEVRIEHCRRRLKPSAMQPVLDRHATQIMKA